MSPRLSSILSLSTSNGLEIESPGLNSLGDVDVFTTATIFPIDTNIAFGASVTGGTATDETYQWSVSPSTGVVISAPTAAATNISFPDYNTEYIVTCQVTSVTSGNSPQSDSVTILTEVETGGGDTAATYTSDFSRDTDGWVYGTSSSWVTDPDLDGDIDGVDGEDDTLRLTFNADPTGNVEIRSGDIAAEGGFAVGDSVAVSFKWRLEDTAPDLSTMNLRVQLGNSYALDKIQTINSSADETWVEESFTYSVESSNTSRFVKLQWGVGGFRPGNGDKFYIKDFNFTQTATASSPLPVYTGLLDTYPNAAAAYSLRRLTRNYTGALIEIQRHDNLETTRIGYLSDGSLDGSSIASFCSGTTCGVKTWFDQSGSGNDATQSDITLQPAIYASGSVMRENGKPAIDFDGTNNFMTASGVTTTQPTTASMIVTSDTGVYSGRYFYDGDDVTDRQAAFISGTEYSAYAGVTQGSGTTATVGLQIHMFTVYNNTSSEIYVNTSGVSSVDLGIRDLNGLIIGRRYSATYPLDGRMQELIFWNANESSNRAGIETEINNFYNIYTPFAGGLLDDYPDAAAAYSLRRLATAYTGPAIRVRRASDNAEQDIQFNSDGTLNTTQLESFCSGTNGFVKTWYCQSGNRNDATQTTTIYQPQIVSSGSVITSADNSLPVIQGVENNYLNLTTSIIGSNDFSIYTASTRKSGDMLYGGNSPRYGIWAYTTNGLRSRFANPNTEINFSGTLPDDDLFLSYLNRSGNDAEMAANGATAATATLVSSNDLTIQYLLVGNGTVSFNYEGQAFEFIFYESDQSSNRIGIESNINNYYTISNIRQPYGGLLGTYKNSAAAYSVRKLHNLAQFAMQIERASDNELKVIGFNNTGGLDTAAIEDFCSGTTCGVRVWYDQSGNSNDATQTTFAAQPKICIAQTNLLLQSNQFDTSPWSEAGSSGIITSGFGGYDGTNDAWQLEHKGSQYTSVRQTLSASGVQTYSVYAKAGTLDYIIVYAVSSVSPKAWFNLSTGQVGTTQGDVIDASMESVGNGWYRCSIVFDDTITAARIYPNDADVSYGTTPGTIYIQDAQLEPGENATGYTETTTTALIGTSLVQENGKPALQFDGSNDYIRTGDYIVELSQNSASVFCVSQANTIADSQYILAEGDSISPYSSNFFLSTTAGDVLWVNGTLLGTMQTGQVLIGFDWDETNATAFINGSQSGISKVVTVNTETSRYSYIGSRADSTTAFFNGKLQELITYKSNQSSNRSGIETNVNDYFGIYP